VDAGDVGVVERGERLGFALEAPQPLLVVRELVGQDLDRHLALEPRVLGAVDLAHSAGAEGAEDLVEGEGLAGGERHMAQRSASGPRQF
jgi:hypothetical protein